MFICFYLYRSTYILYIYLNISTYCYLHISIILYLSLSISISIYLYLSLSLSLSLSLCLKHKLSFSLSPCLTMSGSCTLFLGPHVSRLPHLSASSWPCDRPRKKSMDDRTSVYSACWWLIRPYLLEMSPNGAGWFHLHCPNSNTASENPLFTDDLPN